MLIVSKYKDYYDFLSGIYGVDPNLVLDRREFHNYECLTSEPLIFHICGMVYEGFYVAETKKFYYGDALLELGKKDKYYFGNKRYNRNWSDRTTDYVESVNIEIMPKPLSGSHFYNIALKPYIDYEKVNEAEGCPILMKNRYSAKNYFHFPQLNKFDFASYLKAEDIYKILVEHLSAERTKLEQHVDNRTDVEKLINKGFDKRESFRNIK